MEALADWVNRPLARLFYRGLGLSPNQVSAFSFVASLGAAVVIGAGQLHAGLALMALGQWLDGLDGAMARRYGLASPHGKRIDTLFDRASEIAIFLGFAWSGMAPARLVLLSLVSILLLTTLVERTGIDTRAKRVALFGGLWISYSTIFTLIFAVNLAAFVIALLKTDIDFQHRMDALDGDLDTVASRAAAQEAASPREERGQTTATRGLA
jgi:phosphatidylglycerophosphate synthase